VWGACAGEQVGGGHRVREHGEPPMVEMGGSGRCGKLLVERCTGHAMCVAVRWKHKGYDGIMLCEDVHLGEAQLKVEHVGNLRSCA